MSESGVHAHAPHEEALHHAAEGHNRGLNQWVAIFTALLAALGAVVSYQGSHLMNEVLLHKNEAVLKKAHATDEWNYYQAVSTKQHLMELARDLAPADRQPAIAGKIAKYEGQKTEIKARADALEAASTKADEESDRLNRPHTGMARSLIFLQIAISLASITALTGRKWLFGAAILSALVGVGLWAAALGLAAA
ncbi:hypothetical protein GALL_349680 [mine drainage metagenome]|uniref:DUF4337 domain-containing protein n=1 Tax=mine drainage metagenome TaxID=410659 RepID=A0A1J5R0I9_9ZZZZ